MRALGRGWVAPIAASLVVLIPLPYVVQGYALSIAILILQYAYLGQCWNIMTGFAGHLSLGHALYVGLGAYTAAILSFVVGINVWFGILAAVAVGAGAGAFVGYVGFRFTLRGIYFAMLTLAVAEFARIAFDNFSLVGGSSGFVLAAPAETNVPLLTLRGDLSLYFYLYLALNVVALSVATLILRRKTGYLLRAIRADEDAARALGVRVFSLRVITTAISGGMTAVGGAVLLMYVGNIYPNTIFSVSMSVNILVGPVIGGLGTLLGPIIGAAITVPLGQITGHFAEQAGLSGLSTFVYGVVIIAFVLGMPNGVWPKLHFYFRRLIPAPRGFSRKPVPSPPLFANAIRESTPLLTVTRLRKTFGGLRAVNDVSFEIRRGGMIALIGPNGAGKTTCFNLIAGTIPADDGEIEFAGVALGGLTPERRCRLGICRTFQIVRPFADMTVLENVMVGAFVHTNDVSAARAISADLLAHFALGDKEQLLPNQLTLPDRKLLEVVRALATRPTLLLLDEVMAGLRPSEYLRIVDALRALNAAGLTILLVEHVMRVVMTLAEHVIVLHHGEKLIEGTPQVISRDPRTIEHYLGKQQLIQ